MNDVRITVRREKETKNLALFFINSNQRTSQVVCFTKQDQHTISSHDYIENYCVKVKAEDPEVIQFVKFWENIGPERHNVLICENI